MKVGGYAKYRATGTVGKIVGQRKVGEVQWFLLDTFDLWYDSRLLDPASASEYKVSSYMERTREISESDIRRMTSEEVVADISTLTPSGGG